MSETGVESGAGGGGDDVLDHLDTEPCPWPECEGVLRRDEYKGTGSVVCETCAVPAARVWGDDA